jgi:Fungal protein kinase
MREDPLRRFAFGITIEDTQLRLWLSNRALLAVTEPINFFEVRRHIVLGVRALTGMVHLEY